MYVSDFAMSNKIYPVDVLSINAKQPLQELIFGLKVSIKIFLYHVPVIVC
jgi:hypothetical protein